MVIIAKNQFSFSKSFLLLARPLIYHSALGRPILASRRDKSSVCLLAREIHHMNAFLVSLLIVALSEMGDKTQLLTLLLAARFRKPVPILIAIFLATVVNHGVSAILGQWITTVLSPDVLLWIVALGFIGMSIWMLIPDKLDDESGSINRWQKYGVFGATFVLFFLAEIGDKTQVATIALAARFDSVMWVTLGTTIGIMLVNAPAVFIGNKMAEKLPISLIHKIGAAVFFIMGVGALVQHYFF